MSRRAAAALLLLPLPALAAPARLELRAVRDGKEFRLAESFEAGRKSEARRELRNGARRVVAALSALVGPESEDGARAVEYELELADADGRNVLKLEGEVFLGPGAPLELTRCGGWAASVALVSERAAAVEGNYRVRAGVSTDKRAVRCSLAMVPDSDVELTTEEPAGAGRAEFFFKARVGEPRKDGAIPMRFQIGLPPLKTGGEAALTPGKVELQNRHAGLAVQLSVRPE